MYIYTVAEEKIISGDECLNGLMQQVQVNPLSQHN